MQFVRRQNKNKFRIEFKDHDFDCEPTRFLIYENDLYDLLLKSGYRCPKSKKSSASNPRLSLIKTFDED